MAILVRLNTQTMNKTKTTYFLLSLVTAASVSFYSCKPKKALVKPVATVAEPVSTPEPVKKETTKPEKTETEVVMPVEKPNFNISNVQFEFNSFVLKTASLPILDRAIAEMKKAPDTKFILNGHSSAEGSASHNLSLSVDRANAVKSYFVNAGLSADNFKIVGHGDKKPISTNNTEAGRMLNRRTEIQVVK